MCGSPEIALGAEQLTLSRRDGKRVRVRVRRWSCPNCREKFLTADSRRHLDAALGLKGKRRTG